MARFKINISTETEGPTHIPSDRLVEESIRNIIIDKLKIYPFENITIEVTDQVSGHKSCAEMRIKKY